MSPERYQAEVSEPARTLPVRARNMSHRMAIGHAAGVAAAVALRSECSFAETDVQEIQHTLQAQGALIGRTVERTQS